MTITTFLKIKSECDLDWLRQRLTQITEVQNPPFGNVFKMTFTRTHLLVKLQDLSTSTLVMDFKIKVAIVE
jgi:hypothetical protein